jgi:hypothetical protein
MEGLQSFKKSGVEPVNANEWDPSDPQKKVLKKDTRKYSFDQPKK